MKIVESGKKPWLNIVYTCPCCKCKFKLDATDMPHRGIAKGGKFIPCPECYTPVEL
jgi:hypothetical protein